MVYCILKGITKFARVTFDPENDSVENKDFYRLTLNEVIPDYADGKEDAVVKVEKIKIKKKKWSEVKQDDLRIQIHTKQETPIEIFDSDAYFSTVDFGDTLNNPNRNVAQLSIQLEEEDDVKSVKPDEDQMELEFSFKESNIEYEEIERNVEVTLHSWKLFKEIHKSAKLSTKIYQRSLSPVLNCD